MTTSDNNFLTEGIDEKRESPLDLLDREAQAAAARPGAAAFLADAAVALDQLSPAPGQADIGRGPYGLVWAITRPELNTDGSAQAEVTLCSNSGDRSVVQDVEVKLIAADGVEHVARTRWHGGATFERFAAGPMKFRLSWLRIDELLWQIGWFELTENGELKGNIPAMASVKIGVTPGTGLSFNLNVSVDGEYNLVSRDVVLRGKENRKTIVYCPGRLERGDDRSRYTLTIHDRHPGRYWWARPKYACRSIAEPAQPAASALARGVEASGRRTAGATQLAAPLSADKRDWRAADDTRGLMAADDTQGSYLQIVYGAEVGRDGELTAEVKLGPFGAWLTVTSSSRSKEKMRVAYAFVHGSGEKLGLPYERHLVDEIDLRAVGDELTGEAELGSIPQQLLEKLKDGSVVLQVSESPRVG